MGSLSKVIATATLVILCSQSVAIAQPIISTKAITIYDPPKAVSTQQPTERVAALIAMLSDASSSKRKAAAQSLLKMGPGIEPQLQWALNKEEEAVPAEDLKMRWSTRLIRELWGPGWLLPRYAYHSLSALMDDLEDQRRATPSVITLHYNNALLTDVLSSLGRQIDAKISITATTQSGPTALSLDWVPVARMTIDIDRMSFWDAWPLILKSLPRPLTLSVRSGALDLSEDPAGITFSNMMAPYLSSGRGLPILTNAPGAVRSGPILFAPSLDVSGEAKLTLQAVAEPRVTAVTQLAKVRIDELTDDHGKSLLSPSHRGFFTVHDSISGYSWENKPWNVSIPLAALTPGRHIGTIRGHFSIGIAPPERYIPLAIPASPNGQSVSFDGVVVTLKSLVPDGSEYVVSGEMSTPVDILSDRATYEYLNLRVLDASRQLMRGKLEHSNIRYKDGRYVVDWALTTIEGRKDLVPATLIWLTPGATRWFTVPFELHDIATSTVTTK